MTGNHGPAAELCGTPQQQLVFLNAHWGRKYTFTLPGEPDSPWTATAKFGDHDELEAGTAGELLAEVRTHYQGYGKGESR
jgi:hypothetical protein